MVRRSDVIVVVLIVCTFIVLVFTNPLEFENRTITRIMGTLVFFLKVWRWWGRDQVAELV